MSVGDTTVLEEAKQDLQRLIDEYERIVDILKQIEKEIETVLGEIPMASRKPHEIP